MPRFFFHHRNGSADRDHVGVELADIAAVQCEAVRMLGAALTAAPASFWPTASRQITVADAQDLTLFTLEVAATYSPAYQR